ncbi:arginyl-tRNA-protein transferase [Sulfurifustis variabilis]|uniref:Aspartate/glutamate leucyltransferase n=1 Tax=Sulfurifustis variabilis TaxID=1675686 RepID=A0A1B4V5H9_9GAMM|nr:arginyltransferase [Sulfurifustis variabilis]BAU48800.1 arginyl-tRNA-protein transferase [Sulfurifustis variabilis]
MSGHQRAPDIFLSMPHPCSYLPGKTATTLFIDPRYPLDRERYGAFTRLGFRRSGDLIYRPHCRDCTACVPVRIPTARFRPARGQRRVWRRNLDVRVAPVTGAYVQEHFDLYVRYQARRHPGGGMDDPDPQKYLSFLLGRQVDTVFFEMRLAERLLGVAIVDRLNDGLSAVYTFYDPDESARGLGTFAVLWEVEHARRLGLPWVYLGYWIAESPKMAYKANFRPLEVYRNGRWTELASPLLP